jgi:hypothetical protein
MSAFDSLTLALEPWFDTSLRDLPVAIRKRVEKEFLPVPWDDLSAQQRRSGALQVGYQHDPTTERDQQRWWDFWQTVNDLKRQIAQWEAVAAPTATDLTRKEEKLAAWIWLGPQDGGIAAYVNANELDPPPRFRFGDMGESQDYVSPLMACWFRAEEVSQFAPTERYITGSTLIER